MVVKHPEQCRIVGSTAHARSNGVCLSSPRRRLYRIFSTLVGQRTSRRRENDVKDLVENG